MSKRPWLLLFIFIGATVFPHRSHARTLVHEDFLEKSGGNGLDFSKVKSLYNYVNLQKKSLSRGNGSIAGTIGIFGGFGTCTSEGPYGVEIYERALQLLYDRAAEGIYYRIVASCFATSNKTTYFFGSSDKDTIFRGNFDDVVSQIEQEITATPSKRLYLIGHSYGGWLSIHSGIRLQAKAKIVGIASIDPISRIYCTPNTFINAYLSSMFSFNPEPDCTTSPRDIDSMSAKNLRAHSDWWFNFYQDNSTFVHSGIIGAARNFHVAYDFTNFWDFASAHMDIDNDERVWSTFENLIH